MRIGMFKNNRDTVVHMEELPESRGNGVPSV